MEQQPKVSVIIPVYNVQEYLRQCLDSVVNQTLKNIEIICVDDGSTDDSLNILQEYAAKDSRFTILTQQNQYAGVARNAGLAVARGEFLSFLDSDDWFDPKMLEKACKRIEACHADICVFKSRQFNQKTGQYKTMTWSCHAKMCPPGSKTFSVQTNARNILNFTHAVPWNKLFRKSFVDQYGLQFQGIRSTNDVAFTFTALAIASSVCILNEELVTYRTQNDTSLQGSKDKAPLCFYKAITELYDRLNKYGVYELVEHSFHEYLLHSIAHNLTTLKERVSFNRVYALIKHVILNEFNMMDKPSSYYTKLSQSQYSVFQRVMVHSAEEYAQKFKPNFSDETAPPSISVVIPVYNAAPFLRQGLDSVLSQSLTELEVICVDDGSTDDSLNILREYEARDPRVIVIVQKNQGAAVARNRGIEIAQGEYIHFLDADDYVAEGAYEAMYRGAVEHNADLIKCKARGIDEETGEEVDSKRYDLSSVSADLFNRPISFAETPKTFTHHVGVVPWNGLHKTAFLKEQNIRYSYLHCVNDRSFYAHVIQLAQRIVLLPTLSVYHRTNLSTSLVGQRVKHFECHFQSYEIVKEHCKSLEDKYQALLLVAELNDTFVWFERYQNHPEYGSKITAQMQEFVKTIDMDFFLLNDVSVQRKWRELRLKLLKQAPKTASVCTQPPAPPTPAQKAVDNFYKEELQRVYNSKSYKIGRAITFFPRKTRGLVRCLRENGVSYTFQRIKEKLSAHSKKKV